MVWVATASSGVKIEVSLRLEFSKSFRLRCSRTILNVNRLCCSIDVIQETQGPRDSKWNALDNLGVYQFYNTSKIKLHFLYTVRSPSYVPQCNSGNRFSISPKFLRFQTRAIKKQSEKWLSPQMVGSFTAPQKRRQTNSNVIAIRKYFWIGDYIEVFSRF